MKTPPHPGEKRENSMATDLILTTAQAQAVYSAMCALNASGLIVGKLMADNDAGQRIEIEPFEADGVRVWNSVIGRAERHADQAAFAAAYGLNLRAAADDADATEAEQVFVCTANEFLAQGGLPTLRDLNRAVYGGPSQVIGFDQGGQRQADYAYGWKSAMEHVWNVMRGALVAQRAINNAEQQEAA